MTRLFALPVAPLTRAECREWVLPCALTHCRHHLDNNGDQRGPKPRPRTSGETCALTIAERGEHTCEEVAEVVGTTPQAVHDITQRALRKLGRRKPWNT